MSPITRKDLPIVRGDTEDFSFTISADSVVLTSPSGTKYRLTVADDGTLQTTAV